MLLKSAILKHTYPVKTNFSKHEQISHLAVAWIWPSVKGYSVQCVKPPCFSSQASQSHNFKPSIMQGWLGLTRILKSCVGHRSVFYSTSTNTSVTEFYRQNGFIDQVSTLPDEDNCILGTNRGQQSATEKLGFCTSGSCCAARGSCSSKSSAGKA